MKRGMVVMCDIVKQAFTETVEYLKRLDVKKHHKNLLLKYMDCHNKGIYIHFDYLSSNPQGYYGYYVNRYGLSKEMLSFLHDQMPQDVRLKIIRLKNKTEKEMKEVSERLKAWHDVWDTFNNKINTWEGEKDPIWTKIFSSLIDIYSRKIDEMSAKKMKLQCAMDNLERMEESIRRIGNSFNNADKQILKLVIKHFIGILSKYLSELFGREARIIYSMDEIKKNYFKNKNQILPFFDPNMSHFESGVLGFLKKNMMNMFKIEVETDEKIYCLTACGTNFSLMAKLKCNLPSKYAIYTQMREFLNKNKALEFLLGELSVVSEFVKDESAKEEIGDLIVRLLPGEVIETYLDLLNEYKKHHGTWESMHLWEEEAIKQMKEDFPALQFDVEKKENKIYNLFAKQNGNTQFAYRINEIRKGDLALRLF